MRVPVGKALRVGPGDHVVIRGQLQADAKLGRLFVFASEQDAAFSPYVPNVADALISAGRPTFMSPLSLRLIPPRTDRELKFTSDIDGFICVMQEVDSLDDPRVMVKLTRRVNPKLGWAAWAQRKLTSWQTPKPPLS